MARNTPLQPGECYDRIVKLRTESEATVTAAARKAYAAAEKQERLRIEERVDRLLDRCVDSDRALAMLDDLGPDV